MRFYDRIEKDMAERYLGKRVEADGFAYGSKRKRRIITVQDVAFFAGGEYICCKLTGSDTRDPNKRLTRIFRGYEEIPEIIQTENS